MTQRHWWLIANTFLLVVGLNAVQAQCPKEGCGKPATCPLLAGQAQGKCCSECPICPAGAAKCQECGSCCADKDGTAAAKKAVPCSASIGTRFVILPGLRFPLPTMELEAVCPEPAPSSRLIAIETQGTACQGPLSGSVVLAPLFDDVLVQCTNAPMFDDVKREAKEYVLEARIVETRPGRPDHAIIHFPRVTFLEDQPVSVSIRDGVFSAAPAAGAKPPAKPDGLMQFQVQTLDTGDLLLDLSVQKNHVEESNHYHTIVLGQRMTAIQEVKPGERVKLVLEKNDQGGPRSWIELQVRKAAELTPCEPPKAMSVTLSEAQNARTVTVTEEPQESSGSSIGAPVGRATAERVAPPASCPAGAAPLTQCLATELARPSLSSPSIFRAIKEEGHTRLEMVNGPSTRMTCKSMTWGVPGGSTLKLSAAGERVLVTGDRLKVAANRVIADGKDRLVMEGKVRFSGERDGAPWKITAERVVVNLADGRVEIEARTKR